MTVIDRTIKNVINVQLVKDACRRAKWLIALSIMADDSQRTNAEDCS